MSKEMLGYDLLGAAISILLFVFVPAVGAGSIMAKLAAATLPVLLTGRLADYAKSRVSESINPIEEQKQGYRQTTNESPVISATLDANQTPQFVNFTASESDNVSDNEVEITDPQQITKQGAGAVAGQ